MASKVTVIPSTVDDAGVHHYEVTSLTNRTQPRVGSIITESEIDSIIARSPAKGTRTVTVQINKPKG